MAAGRSLSLVGGLLLVLMSAVFVTASFVIRPNERGSTSTSLGNIQCNFEFNPVGGTSETWEISLNNQDAAYTCTIGRMDGTTYLVFLAARVQILHAQIVDVLAVDGESRPLFEGEHYTLDRQTQTIEFRPELNIQGVIVELKA
jgi:hypothetical protein